MVVSTKGRYALRLMIDLAEHQGDSYLPLKEIARTSRKSIWKASSSLWCRATCWWACGARAAATG